MSLIDIMALRSLARDALKRYMDATAGIDPGNTVMQPLNAAALKAREDFNRHMDELAKLVPATPKERL